MCVCVCVFELNNALWENEGMKQPKSDHSSPESNTCTKQKAQWTIETTRHSFLKQCHHPELYFFYLHSPSSHRQTQS